MNKKQANKTTQQQPAIKKSMQRNASPKPFKYTNLVGIAIIILLGSIIYSNSFNCSFHFDDASSIVANKAIQNLSNIKSLWNYSSNRFIAYFSFAVNYHYGQLNVWGYHLVNLIIHLINACIVGWLTLLIFSTPALKDNPTIKHKKTFAFFVALLFVSHPLATQSVTYIVQRMASLVAMFYLLSLALYMKGRLSENRITKYIWFAGALVSAILALFTKENAYTLPFAILLFEIFFLQKEKLIINFKDYRIILIIAAFLSIMIFMLSRFSLSIFKPIAPTQGNTNTITSLNYLFTQFSVIVKYIQLLFLPINQNADYDFPIANSLFGIRTLLCLFFLLALIGLAIFLFKKYRVISFGIFWFFITLVIESSIVPIDDVIFEHRTYLPSFGFFLAFISALYILLWNKYKYVAISMLLLIIVTNSFLTFNRNKVWKDEVSIWSDVVIKSPNKARPFVNLGNALKNIGQFDVAIEDYTKAININPKFSDAYYNRAVAYDKLSQWGKAITDYSKTIEINPKYLEAYNNRGADYGKLEKWNEAIVDYNAAIKIDSNNAMPYYNCGIAQGSLEQWDTAIIYYSKAIKIDPKYTSAISNRGVSYGKLKQWDKAIADYSKAIKLDPNNASAYTNRGVSYRNLGQYEKAIADYTKAIELDPKYSSAYNNRGFAYAMLGQWDKANTDYTKAIEIDPNYSLAYSNRDIAYQKLNSKVK